MWQSYLVLSGVLPAKILDFGDWHEPRNGLSGTTSGGMVEDHS